MQRIFLGIHAARVQNFARRVGIDLSYDLFPLPCLKGCSLKVILYCMRIENLGANSVHHLRDNFEDMLSKRVKGSE